MSTTFEAIEPAKAATLKSRLLYLFRSYRDAFQERRRLRRLRDTLFSLGDRELMDIGTTRAEIEFVVSNRSIDPRATQATRQVLGV
jgi:uncharacterized protein YjiS (DUF1127 family)